MDEIPKRETPIFRDAAGSRGGTSMPKITKSVEVDAPVEKVFEMLDNPENFPVYVPNVTKVSNIRRSEKRLGDSFDVVYSMMGMEFPETFTYSEYAKPKRVAAWKPRDHPLGAAARRSIKEVHQIGVRAEGGA